MLSRYFTVLLLLLYLMACQTDKPLQDEDTAKVVTLHCIKKTTVDGQTVHYIYTEVGYNKVKLAALEVCELISKEDYKRFKIPSKALAARGGQVDDIPQTIYVLKQEDQLLFYQSTGSDQQLISTYKDGKFDFQKMN